jgi:hypothetical protein
MFFFLLRVVLSILSAIIVLGTAYDIIVIQWLRKDRAELKESYIEPAIKNTDSEKYPLLNHDSKGSRNSQLEDSKSLISRRKQPYVSVT